MADVSLITLSRNLELFGRLSTYWDDDGLDVEKLLVNNANDPRLTATGLRNGWAVVEPGYNMSYSAGNNLAARAATAPWLLLVNDDVVPAVHFMKALWEARGRAAIHGALLLHQDGTVNHAGTQVHANTATDHIGRGRPKEEFTGHPLVPSVTFAAALVNKELWDRLGGLDERYYYGWEDTDFCLRALHAGVTIRCNRNAVAEHDECGTRPRGGGHDHHNAIAFRDRWKAMLPALLKAYCQRVSPERVEGV